MKPEILHHYETMPDVVKLTVVGLGIDPPVLPYGWRGMLGEALDKLVEMDIATAEPVEGGTAFGLTPMGRELFQFLEHQKPKEPFDK